MNTIRKEIIEIIEPYMDKEMTEGCYFVPITMKEYIYKYITRYVDPYEDPEIICYRDDVKEDPYLHFMCCDGNIIIGHYNITPIEKYIVNNGGINLKFVKGNTDYKEVWVNGKTYIFPFKDPTLYTEQEEEDLLKILKELGTQDKK